jgi:hypothetical protein
LAKSTTLHEFLDKEKNKVEQLYGRDPNFRIYNAGQSDMLNCSSKTKRGSDYWRISRDPVKSTGELVPYDEQFCDGSNLHYKIRYRAPPTFHPFKRLPVELRLAIWKEALPDSQTILPTCDSWSTGDYSISVKQDFKVRAEQYTAFKEAFQVFEKSFHRLCIQDIGSGSTASVVGRFNGKNDTLMTSIIDIQILEKDGKFLDLSKVEKFALAHPERLPTDLSLQAVARAMCPRLKTFTTVLGVEFQQGSNQDFGIGGIVAEWGWKAYQDDTHPGFMDLSSLIGFGDLEAIQPRFSPRTDTISTTMLREYGRQSISANTMNEEEACNVEKPLQFRAGIVFLRARSQD